MLAQVIKAELAYREWAKTNNARDGFREQSAPRHCIEVGLVRGSIQTARSLVKTGLVDWEGSDVQGQNFIKLNPSLIEGN